MNTGRHHSVNKDLKRPLARLERTGVAKIILGPIDTCRHKFTPGHVRFVRKVQGGADLMVYSGIGIHRITILGTDDVIESIRHEISANDGLR